MKNSDRDEKTSQALIQIPNLIQNLSKEDNRKHATKTKADNQRFGK